MVVRNPILANKEDANFREALKLYDSKQYKKSLKLIEQNLKKNPNHAESLALRGCLNYHLGHKADALSYINKATSKEPNNYLVGHLAGIYFRAVNNYAESAKWFKSSVDNGSPNKAILRDLSLMQSQIRDYKNLRASRQAYLENQPGYRANWTAVAVAHHLNKDYTTAVSTLSKIEEIIKDHLTDSDMYEHSECILYKNLIVNESGNVEKALELLETDDSQITDRLAFLEYKAKYLLILNRNEEAAVVYRQLLQRNPDNVDYYKLLETALGTASQSVDVRLKLYSKLASFYPRSDPPKFLPLTFLPASHAEFESLARQYIVPQLKRGVPSTFVNIKPLYRNKRKLAVIEKIVLDFYENEAPKLSPTVTVWSRYFLAQHYLYRQQLEKAEQFIDAALDHSPTLVELYIVKARITKHLGDLEKAADIMNQGRKLDLQDRFINSKTTKYLLRANKVDDAINCISLFTKSDDDAVNGCADLHLMQVNWVLLESAEAYARTYKQYQEQLTNPEEQDDLVENIEIYKGLALKRFHSVIENFNIFQQDQFDFHSYCMRRGTARDYIDTLKWEDHIHATPIYVRTIKGLADIYWEIYRSQDESLSDEAIRKKNKKDKKKKTKTQNVKRKADMIGKVQSSKDDADPLGAKLLADLQSSNNILDQLLDYVKPLTTEADKYRTTWELAFDLYKENKKYVLALQALKNLDKVLNPYGDYKLRLIAEKAIAIKTAAETDPELNPAIGMVVQKSLLGMFSVEWDSLLEVYTN